MNCKNRIVYTVQAGDSLYKLSRQYKTTVTELILGNPGVNPYNLQVGMKLTICPGGEYETMQPGAGPGSSIPERAGTGGSGGGNPRGQMPGGGMPGNAGMPGMSGPQMPDAGMPLPEVPGGGNPGNAGMPGPQIPDAGTPLPGMPEEGISRGQMPGGRMPGNVGMPGVSGPQILGGGMPGNAGMPGMSGPQIPDAGMPLPEVPGAGMPIPERNGAWMPGGGMSGIPGANGNESGNEAENALEGLVEGMRLAWLAHVYWNRMYLMSVTADAPDQQAVEERALQTADEITDVFAEYFPISVVRQLRNLLITHVELTGELIRSLKSGDTENRDNLIREWYGNANQIAALLGGQNPFFGSRETRNLLLNHLDLVREEIEQQVDGEYGESIETFRDVVKDRKSTRLNSSHIH